MQGIFSAFCGHDAGSWAASMAATHVIAGLLAVRFQAVSCPTLNTHQERNQCAGALAQQTLRAAPGRQPTPRIVQLFPGP